MTHPYQIRKARREDRATIAAFNHAMARETEDLNLSLATLEQGVTAVFDDPTHGYYWVVESADQIVACMLITYEWSDWRNGQFWWIQSVYVDPDHRRKGVFKTLYRHLEDLSEKDKTCVGLRLYVEQENQRAQSTYEALGMKQTKYKLYSTND